MCINVLRPRPRSFKFGWVSISLCYAKFSVFCPASSAPLSFQWRDLIVINIFCMWLFTHGFIMVHRNRAFSRCMVDYTLLTDQMTTILFSILYGFMYQEAEFATNIQTGRTRDFLYIGIGHYVQTLESYWALPFWIITGSRENLELPFWTITRTYDLRGYCTSGPYFWRLCAFSQKIKQLRTKYPMDLVRNVPRNSKITVLLQ